jgi:hypothetical protein
MPESDPGSDPGSSPFSSRGRRTGSGWRRCEDTPVELLLIRDALAREIAEAHEGRITMANRDGGAQVVTILLPVSPTKSQAAPAQQIPISLSYDESTIFFTI